MRPGPILSDLKRAAVLLPLALLAGCEGAQSALQPGGPGAAQIARLFWIFTVVCAAVWTLVMIALILALLRRRSTAGPVGDPLAPVPQQDRRAGQIIAGAVGATTLILLAFTAITYSTQKTLTSPAADELVIHITGKQWWWDIRYEDAQADRFFNTANELHIPVHRPVRLILTSSDVIHSFWVPNLTGKLDLVPGRQNELQLSAERTGVFRGQCAEFCGVQHAHMGMTVVVDEPDAFETWRNGQIASAAPPSEPERQRGLDVFLSNACVLCHQIRGTPAGGRAGPELTHIGSRRSLAADTLPMSRGSLAAWIIDPQGIKPGAKMPTIKLPANDVNALTAYLEGLK